MNLYSGTPYWMVKDAMWNDFRPLCEDTRAQVVVIGGGITGTLVAHELVRAGIDCCLVDGRTPATGSSCASTALLQYEIDVPLCRMARLMPEQDAVTAYRSCLEAIDELERLFRETGVEAGFRRVRASSTPAIGRGCGCCARSPCDAMQTRSAGGVRRRERIAEVAGFDARAALVNDVSAQMDAYRAVAGLLKYDLARGLRLFTHTEIVKWKRRGEGYELRTRTGRRIACGHVVVAAGFEAGRFLPKRLMQLTSTFAIASQPVPEELLWPRRSLIWETREPYLYIRTDDNGRIIVGGEDVAVDSPLLRRFLLPQKARVLERKFRRLFPRIPFTTEMSWAGTFSSTRDGLPLIGAFRRDPHMSFALGYGGNGITFSMIAARILSRALQGEADPRAHIFSPERPSLR